MLSKVQGNTRNGYFTQASAEYANGMDPKGAGSFCGMFQKECAEKEKEKLLDEVGRSPEEYKGYGANGMWNGSIPNVHLEDHGADRHFGQAGQSGNLDSMDSIPEDMKDEVVKKLLGDRNAPYSILADENGQISYNGVMFQCDFEKNRLCLGDVSNPDNCLNIPLEKGGCLLVNRDNIDGLIQAIGMFSPGDVNRIMRAIAQDAKLQQVKYEIEDKTSGEQVLASKDKEPGGAKALNRAKEGEHESEK